MRTAHSIVVILTVFKTCPTQANFLQILSGLKWLSQNSMNITRRSGIGRSLPSFAEMLFEKLDGYGCWCFMKGGYKQAHGKPVDDIDAACKMLVRGYRCIEMDSDDVCEPGVDEYKSHNPIRHGQSGIVRRCGRDNSRSECSQMICSVESQFVYDTFGVLANVVFDDKYVHSRNGGIFNPDQECKADKSELDYAYGDYPTYDIFSGAQQSSLTLDIAYEQAHTASAGAVYVAPETSTRATTTALSSAGPSKSAGSIATQNTQELTTAATTVAFKALSMAKECCGTFPRRYPYMPRNGLRKCCGGRTYSPLKHDCCDERLGEIGCGQ